MQRFLIIPAHVIPALAVISVFTLAGCHTVKNPFFNNAEYWQRIDLREAVYMDRTEAHGMLHRDIARCVTDVREQESKAATRNAIPADGITNRHSAPGYMAGWDTPARHGYLLNEHMSYHDFESCMVWRGWERIGKVPRDVAVNSRDTYLDHVNPKRREQRAARRMEQMPDGKKRYKNSYFSF